MSFLPHKSLHGLILGGIYTPYTPRRYAPGSRVQQLRVAVLLDVMAAVYVYAIV